jgi:hypothetical protein
MRDLTSEEKTVLEQLIDRTSLETVLQNIGNICVEKAEHIRTNWQDDPLARLWQLAGMRADTCAGSSAVHRVSQ